LSIIIPAYNEEKRIGPTLDKIHSFLKTKDYLYEIVIVDDGSSDNTVKEAKKSSLFMENKLSVISNGTNKGKGFSVKTGILTAKGDYVLFSDADLSTPIEEIDKFFSQITLGFDIAIGSRSIKGSDIKLPQPFSRELMGRLFNLLVRLFILKSIKDTQCGFKLFKAEAAKNIASRMQIDGFVFDVEMLYLARKLGYQIKEVPVVWIDSQESKVSLLGDFRKVGRELFSIKRIHNAD
jgi:dolichyl-phosphate beta-glucosyltransferase